MTSLSIGAPTVRVPSRVRRMLEDVLPWYDREAMRRHNVYSEKLLRDATVSRRNVIHVRRAYLEGAARLGRK
jgi:hypothetical protein